MHKSVHSHPADRRGDAISGRSVHRDLPLVERYVPFDFVKRRVSHRVYRLRTSHEQNSHNVRYTPLLAGIYVPEERAYHDYGYLAGSEGAIII